MPATRRQNAEEAASKQRQTRASLEKSPSQATIRRSTPKAKSNSKNASHCKSKDDEFEAAARAADVSTKKKIKLDESGEVSLSKQHALRGVKRLPEKEEALSEVDYKKKKKGVKNTRSSTVSDITAANGGNKRKSDEETTHAGIESDSTATKGDKKRKGDGETTQPETESDSTAAKGDNKRKSDEETTHAGIESDSTSTKGGNMKKSDEETTHAETVSDGTTAKGGNKEDHETNASPGRLKKNDMKTGHDENVPEMFDTESSKKSDDGESTENLAVSESADKLSIPKEDQGSVDNEQSGNSLTDTKAMSTPGKAMKSRKKIQPGILKRDVAEPIEFTPRKSSRQSVPNRRYLEDVGEIASTPDKVKKSGGKHIPMEIGKVMDPAQKTIQVYVKTGGEQDQNKTHGRETSVEGSTQVLVSPESPVKSPMTVANIVRSPGTFVQGNKSDSTSHTKKLGCVVQVITGMSEQTSPRKIPVDVLQLVKQTLSASIGLPPRESDIPLVASRDTTTQKHGKIVHVVKPDSNTPSKTMPVMKVPTASTSPTKKVTLSPGRIIIETIKTSEIPSGTTSLPSKSPKETDISKHHDNVNLRSTNVDAAVSDFSDGSALDHSYDTSIKTSCPSEDEIRKLPHDKGTKVDLLSVPSSSLYDSKTRKHEEMEGKQEDTAMERKQEDTVMEQNEEDIAMEQNQASSGESTSATNPDVTHPDTAAHSKTTSMNRDSSVEHISQDEKQTSEVKGSDEEDIFQLCEVTGKLKSSLYGTFIEVEEPIALDMDIQSMDTLEKDEASVDTPDKDGSLDTSYKRELTLDTPSKEESTLDTPGKVIPFIMEKTSASPISQILSTDGEQSTILSTASPHTDTKTMPVKIKVVTVRPAGNKATASTQTLINLKTKAKKHTVKPVISMSIVKQEKDAGGTIIQEVIVVNLPEGSTLVDPRPQPEPELADGRNHLMVDAFGLYKCTLCNYTTDRKPNWYKHKKKHLGLRPYGCGQCSYSATTSSNLKRHIEAHSDKRIYMCNVCNLMFKQKIHLQRHLKYRHEKKSVKCPLCNYICAHENPDLKIHLRRKHMHEHGSKEFECKVCSAVNYSKKDLRQHMKLHTTGPEMKLFCQYCSFVSDCNSRLQRHMMTHTQEKPFQCGLCEYRGAQKEHVLRHMKAQHNIDVERNGKLRKDAEDNSNASTSSVEKEKPNKSDFSSTDKIFACNHCNMKFSKLINLYKHLTQQHLEVMPDSGTGEFPCVVCDFHASTKKNLLVHMRKHNTQDHTAPSHVFSCVLCQYTNPKRRNLFLHMRKKHHIEIVMKDDGSANCVVTDKMQMSLIKQCGLNPIGTGEDDEGLTTLTDEEGQLHIVTNDEEVQSGPITVETLPFTVLEHEASSMDTSIVVPGTSYVNPLADHEAAEAIEGLQALSEQSFTDNQTTVSGGNFMQSLLYSQKPAVNEVVSLDTMVVEVEDVSNVAQIETSQEVITLDSQANTPINTTHGLNPDNHVEIPGSQSIQLTEEQLSQLSTGDFVEIDGEMYKVEVANDGMNVNEDVNQALSITSVL